LIDLRKGRLRIRQETARKSLDEEIARTLVGGSYNLAVRSRPIVAHSTLSDQRYTLYLLPMVSPKHLAEEFLSRPQAILLAIQQKVGEPTDPTIVRDLLGLTLGEARVAALVGSGLSPKEAAARLGIARETARSVLKRVFSKVGVSRQSELVALLTNITLG
jgi:DNA-binding CsgD family transcriptional regulator